MGPGLNQALSRGVGSQDAPGGSVSGGGVTGAAVGHHVGDQRPPVGRHPGPPPHASLLAPRLVPPLPEAPDPGFTGPQTPSPGY